MIINIGFAQVSLAMMIYFGFKMAKQDFPEVFNGKIQNRRQGNRR